MIDPALIERLERPRIARLKLQKAQDAMNEVTINPNTFVTQFKRPDRRDFVLGRQRPRTFSTACKHLLRLPLRNARCLRARGILQLRASRSPGR